MAEWKPLNDAMLDELLAIDSGLTAGEIQFLDSLSDGRDEANSCGYPLTVSAKQAAWLKRISERF